MDRNQRKAKLKKVADEPSFQKAYDTLKRELPNMSESDIQNTIKILETIQAFADSAEDSNMVKETNLMLALVEVEVSKRSFVPKQGPKPNTKIEVNDVVEKEGLAKGVVLEIEDGEALIRSEMGREYLIPINLLRLVRKRSR